MLRIWTLLMALVLAVLLVSAPNAAGVEAATTCPPIGETSPSDGPLPVRVDRAVDAALGDARLRGVGLGFSLWIEGHGLVSEVNPTLRLRPASTQKLLTAAGALDILGPDTRFETIVRIDGLAASGELHGNLYLVGGGDPTLARQGEHSLDRLAVAVRAAGISRIRGDVIGDETRYDGLRAVASWSEGVTPSWVGSLSALVVDENRAHASAPAISQPATMNASAFRVALLGAGVAVDGNAAAGAAPSDSVTIASVQSPPVRDLVAAMLTDSNNTIAELLVKEIGYRATGIGSTAAGMETLAAVAAGFCLPETVLQQDGSGLSHGNARSVQAWRMLLQAVRYEPWFGDFESGLAVAGETGTLRFRFRNTAVRGNLRAKTGTISGIRALSGYLTTAEGDLAVFSAIVDDEEPRVAMNVIDELLVELAKTE